MDKAAIASEFDAFISYTHEFGFYMANIIYNRLISDGFRVFMDKTMKSGKYESMIRDAAANCKNFIVVLFPGDKSDLCSNESWLNKEASWALNNPDVNIIPVFCDDFMYDDIEDRLTDTIKTVLANNGVVVHKDNSFDRDIGSLINEYLKNVNSGIQLHTTSEFFRYNLFERTDLEAERVDVAFHAGVPWLKPGDQRALFTDSMKKGVKWRVLINTRKAADSLAKYMRDEDASYMGFSHAINKWKKQAQRYPETLEVRISKIPIIHVHHAVHFKSADGKNDKYSELHIKYYAYKNTNPDSSYVNHLNSFSKYYRIYSEEFEYLWDNSKPI